ncbi:MAG: hypothetical protein IIC13_13725 [SAR324 cluster bacterium]|nr:hypothetical protein [SAR324 cluster bacterium]
MELSTGFEGQYLAGQFDALNTDGKHNGHEMVVAPVTGRACASQSLTE